MNKNIVSALLAFLMLGLVLGCNCRLTNSGKGSTQANTQENTDLSTLDVVTQTVMGEDKTGIAECDEFLNTLEKELQSEDADFVTRNVLYYFKQQIAIQAKSDISNKAPQEKAELAKQCKLMAVQLKENLKDAKK